MVKQGPGKIRLESLQTIPQSQPNELLVKIRVDLYNFDIDVARPLKDEHKKFLNEKIVPALVANKNAKYILMGSASRSGEDDHNHVLSGARAEEVQSFLAANNVGSQIVQFPIALGEPKEGKNEDERDRAVFVYLDLPIKLEDLTLWTDDWSRSYRLDDMIGLLGTDKKSIDKINIQVEASGAPRIWDLGNLSTAVMPTSFPLDAKATRDGKTLIRTRWDVPKADAKFQPTDRSRTVYHLSGSVAEMGFSINREPSYAGIVGNGTYWSFFPSGWASRGTLGAGNRSDDARFDEVRLLQAGGYELIGLSVRMSDRQQTEDLTWVLRSPADVFYYSGTSVSPVFLRENWKTQSDIKVLIIGAMPALAMNVVQGVATGGSGAGWASLLKTKGGPLTTILGYRDGVPSPGDQQDIARAMGAAVTSASTDDQWANLWLGNNTPGAVVMNRSGYWWIRERSWAHERIYDKSVFWGDKYTIEGPAPIR
jgi:hypothetical protein